MQGLRNMLLKEQNRLEEILRKVNKELATLPDGKLRISNDNTRCRYYHCLYNEIGTYIPKSNTQLPRQLAQKTYDISVVKKIEVRLKQIRKLIKDYTDNEIEEIYTSLNEKRQALITPVEPTWNQVVAGWYEEEYHTKEFQEGTPVILTENGERVRSKSEKILADYFYRRKIPYKYEKPLYLSGYGMVYPDFTILSRKTGQEIFWEHEGMMDKQEYARSAVRKLESYQKNGIFPGEQLILTFETELSVLNTTVVEVLVNKYL